MVAQLGQIDHDLDYLQVVPYMPLWKVVVQDPRTDPTQETCATININTVDHADYTGPTWKHDLILRSR